MPHNLTTRGWALGMALVLPLAAGSHLFAADGDDPAGG